MKKQKPTDASRDAVLNGVVQPDGSRISWAAAFPLRPEASGLTTHPTFENGETR